MVYELRNWPRIDFLLFFSTLICLIPGLLSSILDEENKATFLTAAIGEAVIFNCQLDFPHDVVIPYNLNWNKEGQTVFSWYDGVLSAKEPYKGRVRLLPPDSGYGKGSINLTNVRESDGGWYECRVFFPNRSPRSRNNGTWFHLTVDGGNLIAIPPINQTTMEGESARFPCVTKDKTSKIVWLKDGIPLTDLQNNITSRSFVGPDGSLTISPTAMGDLGEFTCEATNSSGEKQSAGAFLNVQYKARVLFAPKEIYLPYGRSASLDCHFRANPPLTNLRWEKDGFLFDPYNVQGVFYRRNGSLYFSEIDEFHGGRYTCTPYNELGTEGPSPVMNVIVLKPPVFTVTPHNLYLRRKGDKAEMPCDAVDPDGKHKPTISWFKKDGTPLPNGRTAIFGGNLTIENIEEGDRGMYQCVAFNEAETIAAETELMVENFAPRAPYNLSSETGRDFVTVRWQSGFAKPEMDFAVWYRSSDNPDWKSFPANSRDAQEITIDKLMPGREYEVMVLSQDVHGDGMFSKSIKVKTQGQMESDSPTQEFQRKSNEGIYVGTISSRTDDLSLPSAPRNVDVALTPEGWLITWDPPANDGHSDHYKVRWYQGDTYIDSADTTETFYLAKDLDEDKTYQFQVYGVSKNDFQTESSKIVFHIPSYRKVRAVSLGLGLGFVFLVAILLIAWFVRRHYLQNRLSENTKRDRISISS